MRTVTRKANVALIAERIIVLRGQRVLLDMDLATLYGVKTKVLNQAVRRNKGRFPDDFAFQLDIKELRTDLLQIATGSRKHRDPRHPPLVFTEHGAFMAAALLNSPRAVEMSVYVVRAFVKLVATLDATTRRQFEEVYTAIRALMTPPASKSRPIGFTADLDEDC